MRLLFWLLAQNIPQENSEGMRSTISQRKERWLQLFRNFANKWGEFFIDSEIFQESTAKRKIQLVHDLSQLQLISLRNVSYWRRKILTIGYSSTSEGQVSQYGIQ